MEGKFIMTTWQTAINNLDIIIPVYKDLNGVIRTIFSFDPDYPHNFTIVIDGPDDVDYEEVNRLFANRHNITFYRLNENCGPGMARNAGIKLANKELIMFIDAGDTLCDVLRFQYYLTEIWEHPNFWLCSPSHQEEHEGYCTSIYPANNRMHGKIYRTQFLKNNGIIFNPNYPRANEDIGFNMTGRLVAREISRRDGLDHIYHYNEDIVCWRNDAGSLTRQNNCAYYYKENNMGLAQNSTYAIKTAQRIGVRRDIVEDLIYDVIPSLYIFYYASVNEQPEYAEQQYAGAVYFYLHILKDMTLDMNKLLQYYNEELSHIYQDGVWHPFTNKFVNQTFPSWLEELKENSQLEKYKYLLE